MEFFKEWLQFIKYRKKFFLIPLVVFLFMLGALIFMSSGSVVAPFIYTLF